MPESDKPKKEKAPAQTFEQALKRLEEVVEMLESGKLGLEQGLDEFEKGVKLYKECKDLMDRAEKKIAILTENLKENDYLLGPWASLSLLGLAFACASPKQTPGPGTEMIGVDLENDHPVDGPTIESHKGQAQDMGPAVPEGTEASGGTAERLPVVAVYFLPGLHRSLAYTAFLKAMERERIPIHMLCGSEFGAVVGAHYADRATPSSIEWLFYKFFEKVKGVPAYSKSWKKELDAIMLAPLKGKNIEGLKGNFCATLRSPKGREVDTVFKGPLLPLLEAQFSPRAAYTLDACPVEALRARGADIIVAVSALGESADFERPNEMMVGSYTKAIGLVGRDCKRPDVLVKLSTDDMKLDQTNDFSPVLKKSLENSLSSSRMILEYIQKWQQHQGP